MGGSGAQATQEAAVGISVYARPDTPGFSCIVKQRYTDFLVNEILPDGHVLHLGEATNGHGKKRKRGVEVAAHTEEEPVIKKPQTNDLTAIVAADCSKPLPEVTKNEETTVTTGSNATAPGNKVAVTTSKEAAIASISAEDNATLSEVLGEGTALAVLNLYASVCTFPHRKPRDHPTVDSDVISDRAQRTEAHMCIRRIFDSKLETLTIPDETGLGSSITIKAAPIKSASRSNTGQRDTQGWPELGGEYLHFTLYKENKDTMEVLYFLASQLKLNTKHFSFAGTKDRRGVTVQRVAVHKIKRERMEALNRLARGWKIGGPWEYKKNGLDLGMLSGNEFLLTLRDVRLDSEQSDWNLEQRLQGVKSVVETAARSLGQVGFINYYGLQRFGTHAVGTHVVGMRMLKEDFKAAVDAILTYNSALVDMEQQLDQEDATNGIGDRAKVPRDDIKRAVAIHAFTTGQPGKEVTEKLRYLGNRFGAEKGIITHLGTRNRKTDERINKNDYQGALNQIQRNLRLMYVHAYQSYVWNTVAGKRWDTSGAKVIEGDLVIVGDKEREEGNGNHKIASVAQVDEDGEQIVLPSESVDSSSGNAAISTAGSGLIPDDPFVRARPLTKAEVESGRYTIFDIVLPLPGFDVVYPENEIGNFYKEFMASESGGGLDPYKMRRGWKDISLSGGYRKMMGRPLGHQVEVDVRAYSRDEEQMVETDLEKLKARSGSGNHDQSTNGEAIEQIPGVDDKIAVLLKLQLSSSQYATIALRELTKGGAAGYTPEFSVTYR